MTEPQERLGQAINALDSLHAIFENMSQLPDKVRVGAIKGALPGIIKEMKEAFIETTGENPWE